MKKLSTILLAALCSCVMIAGMAACSDSSGSTQASGINPFALSGTSAVTSSPVSTAQPSAVIPAEGVTGTWTMNIDYSGMDEATAQQYHAQFDTITMTMTFSDGGVMTTHAVNASNGASNDTTGSWVQNGMTLTLTMQDGSQSVFVLQNGMLRCQDAGSTMIYLTRGGTAPTPQPSAVVASTPDPTGTAVVGTWTMNVDYSGMDEATAEAYRQQMAGLSMSMVLNADGSFQSYTTNATTGENNSMTGTWSMAGDTVTMTGSDGQTEHFTYANGRLTGVESYILYFTR